MSLAQADSEIQKATPLVCSRGFQTLGGAWHFCKEMERDNFELCRAGYASTVQDVVGQLAQKGQGSMPTLEPVQVKLDEAGATVVKGGGSSVMLTR